MDKQELGVGKIVENEFLEREKVIYVVNGYLWKVFGRKFFVGSCF